MDIAKQRAAHIAVELDEVIQEMRGWLSDCEWADADAEYIASAPRTQVINAVQRHFDGGVTAFVDTLYLETL